jgi:UDP-N-acetyl-D-mannosaminuronic acid transferase (WecB/TagA/CpsF family)
MGEEVIDNVNGTDLFPLLCELALKKNYSLYLLGSKPGVAAKTKLGKTISRAKNSWRKQWLL